MAMYFRKEFVALFLVLASGLDEEMWGPNDSMKAFDSIEKALAKVVALPHLSAVQQKHAKHVADDVRKAIAAVESSSNLTKTERNAKIGAAVKELADLESDFNQAKKVEQSAKQQALQDKLSKLQKELSEKKQELAKDEASIKLYTLQKELAEKKLELQKLIEQKTKAQTSKKAEAAEAAEESALVTKLTKLTSTLAKVDKKEKLPAPLTAALAEVQAFSKKESDELNQLEAADKKTSAELDAQLGKALATKGKDDALKKAGHQSLIKRLKKEEHREFMKARAHKKALLSEIKDIEKSIEQRDATKLQQALGVMQHQSKALAAKSGDFLH